MIRGHESRNESLRQTLIGKGIDLDEPRPIECHFWASSPEDTDSLAQALITRGFRIPVQHSAASAKNPSLWNLEAVIDQSIELPIRREFTDELVRVAALHCARYDGWGTRI
jgi:hypothetical protein